MALQNALRSQSYSGIGNAMLGRNFGFGDLANYERSQRSNSSQDIKNKLAERRARLSEALNKQGQEFFALNNPKILEDLNARGLFTSDTARNQAQTQALKEIALSNQQNLNAFDTNATDIEIAADQAGLDAVLDLRRSELENNLAEKQADQEQSFAMNLAKDARKQSLTESLIGAGSQLGGALLMGGGGGGGGGGLRGLFGGGGGLRGLFGSGGSATAGPAGTSPQFGPVGSPGGYFGAGGSLLNTSGAATPGLGSVAGGLVGYEGGRRVFRPTQEGDRAASNTGAAIGAAGGSFFGPAGSAVGSFLGTAVGKAENRIAKGAKDKLGGTAGSIAKYALPTTAIPAAIKKLGGGKKSGSTGSGNATATEQRALDSERQELLDLKSQVAAGNMTQAEYLAQAQPYINQIAQKVGHLTSKGSRWASAINPNWQRFLDEGLVSNRDGQWVAV